MIFYSKVLIIFGFLFFHSLSKADCEVANNTEKVVVAGGSLTEIMFFLGLEDKIVALDITSSFPEAAKQLPSIGYVRALSTEGVISLTPTLVIGEDDMGPPNVIEQIKKAKIDIRIIPETHSSLGIQNKILCLSKIFAIPDVTEKKIEKELNPIIKDLKILRKDNITSPKKILLILSMQGTSPIVAGKETPGDGFIKMTGSINAMHNFIGWKPVSPESIILADPDYILITSRGMKNFSSIDELIKQPAIKLTNAAKNKNILDVNGMAMLGFGPRGISTALEIAKKIYAKN